MAEWWEDDRKNYLSLGAGVQSSTVALMAACGEITPPLDAAFFADTQDEPQEVYDWLDWMIPHLPYPATKATYGDLMKDTMRQARSKKSGNLYTKNLIPMFVRKPDGKKGMLPRKCTMDYKIAVVRREMKKHMGIRRVIQKMGVLAYCWMGISTDEAHRMKDSNVPWLVNRYPLIEKGMSRQDCLDWVFKKYGVFPPRSACRRCPYQDDARWMQHSRETLVQIAQWEKQYQDLVAADESTEGVPYLHESLVPIDQVVFNPEKGKQHFGNECEGMCGV